MTPDEVNADNEQQLRNTVYNYKHFIPPANGLIDPKRGGIDRGGWQGVEQRRRANFRVGDYVRISKYRTVFEKGYTPNWTTEIFRIRKVQYHTDPITYLLDDYQNQEIKGCVYAEELQLVAHPDVYLIEKILRKRKGQVYVKWLGFKPEHNSWIPEKNVL